MGRARPKPRRRPGARPSKLRPCVYRPDPTLPDPGDSDHPLCACALPYRHPRHTEPAGMPEAQAEHRRRTGDREED